MSPSAGRPLTGPYSSENCMCRIGKRSAKSRRKTAASGAVAPAFTTRRPVCTRPSKPQKVTPSTRSPESGPRQPASHSWAPITAARSGAEGRGGLRVFHDARPDLVVLDVSVPGFGGWEVLARMRDMSDAPVMMLTALGAELERVRGLKGGADDYIAKPFGRQELLARV